MKLSISNIGWEAKDDLVIYAMMKKYGFQGLEIAPTRIFPEAPYEKNDAAGIWSERLKRDYGFSVPSMQSIWYGRQEKIFGTFEERQELVNYTKKAIDFAVSIDCKNLVFGCPRNRNLPKGADDSAAIPFFKEISDYAAVRGTTIGMEANPSIYNTNYINDTVSALKLGEQVDSEGFKLNLDVGTMIQNEEDIGELKGKVYLINHVHISEPRLQPIRERIFHEELRKVLEAGGYNGFISIEMGKTEEIAVLEKKMSYVRRIFGSC